MNDHPFPPPQPVELPIDGSALRFPVRRVYCIGRNYADQAREMGHDPDREPPFFFQKNADNLDPSGAFAYPSRGADIHHEVELAVALGKGGADIPEAEALGHVYGYAVALDMTRRDLQGEAKQLGRPWEIGKAFERSAPIGPITPAAGPVGGSIALTVNGAVRQEGDLGQMIWKVPEIVAYLSRYFDLAAGDVILTGTPAGVGPVVRGDRLEARIAGLEPLVVRVV
jgi:fumarylpyruvate hydrolase